MSVFNDCGKNRDRVGRCFVRVRRMGSLICLMMLAALSGIGSAIAADAPPAKTGEGSVVEGFVRLLQGKKPDAPAKVAEPVADPNSLTTVQESPEFFKKIAEKSLYPKTDAPDKLTAEQLDAIAKLAPRCNSAGIRVHPAMVPLFRNMVIRYTGGHYRNQPLHFRLHTPEHYEIGKTYPLVVWLHGAGECGNDNVNQLSHLHHIIPWLAGPKKRDFFLLAAQCPHDHSSWEAPEICKTEVLANGAIVCHMVEDPVARGDAPISYTLAMVDAVMKKFPVDPGRVTLAGLSTGGDGTWRTLERRPDLFAAAVPIVSWQALRDKPIKAHPILKKLPIWAIYSSDDNGIDFARKEFQRIKDAGCNANKTEFGVCGHRAWTPAMLQGDVFGWLISRGKEGERFHAVEFSPTSPEKIGIFADVTEGDLKQPTKARRPRPEVPAERTAVVAPRPTVTSGPVVARGLLLSPSLGGSWSIADVEAAHRRLGLAQASVPNVDQLRMKLVERYLEAGEVQKALATADKVHNRQELVTFSLVRTKNREVLDYIDRELDRMERQGVVYAPPPRPATPQPRAIPEKQKPLEPIPAGAKTPKEECGKEWAMSTDTVYGLFANGWEQEADHLPDYVINENGQQLRDRLAKAFAEDNLPAMKEFCNTILRLDDIPMASPWFNTSGGRLQSRIKYELSAKAKPVVDLLREIAAVKAESKAEFVDLAKKTLKRLEAITHPKSDE